jgi:hypothetical protein
LPRNRIERTQVFNKIAFQIDPAFTRFGRPDAAMFRLAPQDFRGEVEEV